MITLLLLTDLLFLFVGHYNPLLSDPRRFTVLLVYVLHYYFLVQVLVFDSDCKSH